MVLFYTFHWALKPCNCRNACLLRRETYFTPGFFLPSLSLLMSFHIFSLCSALPHIIFVSFAAPAFSLFLSISSPVPLLKRGFCALICPLQHPPLAQGDGKPWPGYSHEIHCRDLHSTVISPASMVLANLFSIHYSSILVILTGIQTDSQRGKLLVCWYKPTIKLTSGKGVWLFMGL